MSWKALLQEALAGLTRTHAQEPLSEIQRILRGVLNLDEVRFQGADGRELRGDLTLHHAIERCAAICVRIQLKPAAVPASTGDGSAAASESRFREGPAIPDISKLSMDERTDLFLKEFIRLEDRHDFMWAGYIVRELLPRLGFSPDEAKIVLDHLRAENLVKISKVPNPKNPEFPATGVHLNREHPRVITLLSAHAAHDGPGAAPSRDGSVAAQGEQTST
jgi:hypothetical protein